MESKDIDSEIEFIDINELAKDLGVTSMNCEEDSLEDLMEYFDSSENFNKNETLQRIQQSIYPRRDVQRDL